MLHARDDYNRIQDPEGKIPADEPVFLLRGQDELAIHTMTFHLNLLRQHAHHDLADLLEAHIARVRDWPVKKRPDLPPEPVVDDDGAES